MAVPKTETRYADGSVQARS